MNRNYRDDISPRMGYQLVSLIPEEDRIEEIRRTWQQEDRLRTDLLKTGECVFRANYNSHALPLSDHDLIARLDPKWSDDPKYEHCGAFLIRRKQ